MEGAAICSKTEHCHLMRVDDSAISTDFGCGGGPFQSGLWIFGGPKWDWACCGCPNQFWGEIGLWALVNRPSQHFIFFSFYPLTASCPWTPCCFFLFHFFFSSRTPFFLPLLVSSQPVVSLFYFLSGSSLFSAVFFFHNLSFFSCCVLFSFAGLAAMDLRRRRLLRLREIWWQKLDVMGSRFEAGWTAGAASVSWKLAGGTAWDRQFDAAVMKLAEEAAVL